MNIAILIVASLFIPQGNEDTIAVSPLNRGEAAYVVESGTAASVRIGKDDSSCLDVVDRTALRGYRVKDIDRLDYVVYANGATYESATDCWKWMNPVSNQVYTVTIKAKYDILDHSRKDGKGLECHFVWPADIGGDFELDPDISFNGKEVTLSVRMNYGGRPYLKFSIERIQTCEFGDRDHVTDLTKHKFNVIDTIGESSLSNWRKWCIHYWDGNRGDDWSSYGASNHVKMLDYSFQFGGKRHGIADFAFGLNSVNTNETAMLVSGNYAMKFYNNPDTIVTNGTEVLKFTSIVNNANSSDTEEENNIVMRFIASNFTSFDLNYLHLYYATEIDYKKNDWHRLDDDEYTVSGTSPNYKILVPRTAYKQGFYKLRYGNSYAVTEILDVAKIHKLVILGDDGKWYRISVNAGTISASEYTF